MRDALRVLAGWGVLVGSVALGVGALGAASLLGTQAAVAIGRPPIGWMQAISNLILRSYGLDVSNVDPRHYVDVLGALANTWLAFVAIGLSLGPPIGAANLLLTWRRRHALQVRQIRQEGRDDLNVMYRYIEKAKKVVIYSGDFSWLNPASRKRGGAAKQHGGKLRGRLGELAEEGKLTLVSSDTPEQVWQEMGEAQYKIYGSCLVHDNPHDLRCSIIWFGNETLAVLDLIRAPTAEGGGAVPTVMCILTDAPETRGMLRTFGLLLGRQQVAPKLRT